MFKIKVIGVADSLLSTRQYSLLTDCLLVVGAGRMRDMATDFADRYLEITPLRTALSTIAGTLEHGNVAVLASGDPLFYGIGRKLLAEFGDKNVDFFPALSSIQRACALFRLPWDDARITSLHGRSSIHLPGILLRQGKHLVLTDTDNSPDRIAGHLLHYLRGIGATELVSTIRMLVAEDLGLAWERIFTGNLGEASSRRFSALNVVCLLVPPPSDLPAYHFGLGEEQLHHSRGLITKNEVRAATLHQLRLPESGIFWDIGAGSGSLSIEAARINPQLTLFAVEQKDEELKNIKNNIVKFRCFNIVAHPGRRPKLSLGCLRRSGSSSAAAAVPCRILSPRWPAVCPRAVSW